MVIAIHPTSRGFGWTLFETPNRLATWAIADAPGSDKNAKSLERVEKLFDTYSPSVVVLEEFESKPARRSDRVKRLYRAIIRLAEKHNMEVRIYPRTAVEDCFQSVGAKTRYEIAQAVAMHVDALRHALPPKPKLWHSEHRRMGLFQAAALALTYFSTAGDEEAG